MTSPPLDRVQSSPRAHLWELLLSPGPNVSLTLLLGFVLSLLGVWLLLAAAASAISFSALDAVDYNVVTCTTEARENREVLTAYTLSRETAVALGRSLCGALWQEPARAGRNGSSGGRGEGLER